MSEVQTITTKDLRKRCPECQEYSRIDICASLWVRLKQYSRDGEDIGSDADESRNGDHEWDESSDASCGCGWHGKVSDLTTKDSPEDEDESAEDAEEPLPIWDGKASGGGSFERGE